MKICRALIVLLLPAMVALVGHAAAAPPESERPSAAAPGSQWPGDRDDDHERARNALERGEIMPLQKVLAVVQSRIQGEIAEVELEREDGIWAYEVKIIAPNGRMIEVYVDAGTAEIMKIEGE